MKIYALVALAACVAAPSMASAATAASAAAAGGSAQNEAETAARCLSVMIRMASVSGNKDSSVLMGSTYWLGRYDAYQPSGSLPADVVNRKDIAPAEFEAVARSCMARLSERIQAIGAAAATAEAR